MVSQPTLVLIMVVIGLSFFSAGVCAVLWLTGGSVRCVLGRHSPSSQIWTSRTGVGYICPHCGVLSQVSDPLDQLKP